MGLIFRFASAAVFVLGMPVAVWLAADYMLRGLAAANGGVRPQGYCLGSDCYPTEWIEMLRLGALGTGLAALALVGLFVAASILCGTKRWLNAAVFPALIWVAKVGAVLLMLADGILVLALVYVGKRYLGIWPHSMHMELALAGGTLAAVCASAWALFQIDPDLPMRQLAVEVTPAQAPELWEGVHAIAEKLGAKPPDNIIVGLGPTFYACAAPIRLPGREGRTLTGQTLYLSTSLLRLLTVEEVTAVVGHELGHFRGADTVYSMRFAPLYNGLYRAMYAIEEQRESLLMDIVLLPVLSLLKLVHDIFSLNQAAIGRTREYAADRCGAEVASPRDIATSLGKIGLAAGAWPLVEAGTGANLARGLVSGNVSRDFEMTVAHALRQGKPEDLVDVVLRNEISHPFDSHPSTRRRMKALKVNVDVLNSASLAEAGGAGAELIRGFDRIEDRLTTLFCAGLQESGEVDEWKHALASAPERRDPGLILSEMTDGARLRALA